MKEEGSQEEPGKAKDNKDPPKRVRRVIPKRDTCQFPIIERCSLYR